MLLQMNLYEVLGLEDDPVYRKINSLKENDEVKIESFNIRKTDKFYEVENEELHEGFKTKEKCYSFISSKLQPF
ncbi:hypothetical protein [Lysinibacillus halotolerans]|uniref:Uncharacterized protein n=1 Tax=Lysinibacillus halotolerans TaxID=1368476 RepID=A0A3M8H779_9BACI|nr:hypothetical protein [Lysinibacillus halotolerans]RNC98255.1 hypothetical protein EC501_11660 [Lysinibacillus halotolerans]